MPEIEESGHDKRRRRAAIACRLCNGKRIKCDAAEGLPCSNCKRSSRNCQLIESRRGQRKVKNASDSHDRAAQNSHQHAAAEKAATEEGEVVGGQQVNIDHSSSPEAQNANGRTHRQPDFLESLHTQVLDSSASPNVSLPEYCQPSVSLSEASNCTISLPQKHYGKPSFSSDIHEYTKPSQEEFDVLAMQHAFDLPESKVCMQLFRVFFIHVAPFHPILDRADFIFQFAIPKRPPSWLLLQAVLFAAASHCEEQLLRDAGLGSKSSARTTLFNRAKALYDADFEKDKFTIVQATFLMSLWWTSPVESKDNWHWLNVAINGALSIGMHHSMKDSGMPFRTQRLWKKLWWSLYTEDKILAAVLGRPVRLRRGESDVEQLEMADFEGEPYGFDDTFTVGLPKAIMAYPICLASLAMIVERLVEQSSQTQSSNSPHLSDAMLQVWEAGLPEFYQVEPYENIIWSSMIKIAAWYVMETNLSHFN